jgi:SAM-dependent methyltransferase
MTVAAAAGEWVDLEPGKDYRRAGSGDLRRDIVRYYEESYWDYRTSWMDGRNLAIHYGYWAPHVRSHAESLLEMNRVLATAAAVAPGERILDAGCGVGGSAIWLAEEYAAEVVGITLSPSQARMAVRQCRRRGVAERVSVTLADFHRTPFADASFDVVWCQESVCHAQDKAAFVREAARLLRPGGRLMVSDGFARRQRFSPEEWPVVLTCLEGWAVPNLATVAEFAGYLGAAGLHGIRHEDVTAFTLPSARRMSRTARLTQPMQRLMRALGLRSDAQTGNFLTALNQHRIFAEGMACHAWFVAHR